MGSFVAFSVTELPARPVVLACTSQTLTRSTKSWVRPHFYIQASARERKEGTGGPVRAEGQVCG